MNDKSLKKQHRAFLDDWLGHKAHVVLAAAKLAEELFAEQQDSDYFQSCILPLVRGSCWLEEVGTLLFRLVETHGYSSQELIEILQTRCQTMVISEKDDWTKEMRKKLGETRIASPHYLTKKDWQELEYTLSLFQREPYGRTKTYFARLKTNRITFSIKYHEIYFILTKTRDKYPNMSDEKWRELCGTEYNLIIEDISPEARRVFLRLEAQLCYAPELPIE